MSRASLLLLAGALAALSACRQGRADAAETPKATGAVLLIASDVRGYLAPCGCSENMRGGIARAAYQVAEARKGPEPVFFFDAGDSLFGQERIPEAQVLQEEQKARTLAEEFKQMGLAARGTGPLDLARGRAFVEGLKLPEVPDGGFKLLDAQGHKLGVVAAGSDAALVEGAKKARAAGAELVVAFFERPFEEAVRAAGLPGLKADLIVAAHNPGEFSAEESQLGRAQVPVAKVQSKGRSLLRVDLSFGGSGPFELLKSQAETEREVNALGERMALLDKQINSPGLRSDAKAMYRAKIEELAKRREALLTAPPPVTQGKNTFAVRFVPLENTLPSLPQAQELVKAYDREVAKVNLAWAKQHGRDCPPPKKGEAAFVGSAACKECHAEAFPVWEGMKHSRAYASLEEQGKQYHLNCIGCHVTGFEKPGGVCRVDKVQGRESVGCESCHGPGSIHVADPSDDNILAKPGKDVCVVCHNPENSPHFDFATYLPNILGKGHGQKSAGGKAP